MSEITLFPFLRDLPKAKNIKKNLIAGLSVGLIALPQAMAYAFVAGLPLIVGVITAIFGTLLCALFGASKYLVSGPTNTVSILLVSAISGILFTYYGDLSPGERQWVAITLVVQATLLVGLLQLGAALLGLGKLAQFVSRPVVKGYVCGACFAIIISQLPVLLGLSISRGSDPIYVQMGAIAHSLRGVSWATLIVGGASLVMLLVMRRVVGRAYAALIVFVLAGLISYLWDFGVATVASQGPLDRMIDRPAPPFLDLRTLGELLPVAFAISLLGALEVTAIVKSLGGRTGETPNMSQEVFGLGVANLLSSFFGAMPSSGSFSRTIVNLEAGAASRWAAIWSAPFVALLYFGVGKGVGVVPLATFAALLVTIAFSMVDSQEIKICLRTTHSDRIALVVTFASCLIFSLSTAFYIGVILSVVLYLRKAATPTVIEVGVGAKGEVLPLGIHTPHPHVKVIDVEGELFFGAVDFFQRAFEALATERDVRCVILRLKNAHHLDATICIALKHVHSHLNNEGIQLLLCGLSQPAHRILTRSGLREQIGSENLFSNDITDALGSTRRAFARAEMLAFE